MKYQHILVAVDLQGEHSARLLQRGAELAKALGCKLSLIHVDINFAELYDEVLEIDTMDVQQKMTEQSRRSLAGLATLIDYPLSHILVAGGDITSELGKAIQALGCDLLICGHHHTFWSRFLPSPTKHLLDGLSCEMLVVPLS